MLDRLLISSSARAIDPQFRNVTLLLHGDGSNGGQNNTFIDSSSNNFTVTRNGNTTQGSFSPYGSRWSNYFNGSSYHTSPSSTAFAFGTGDYTIECWVYPISTQGNMRLWQFSDNADNADINIGSTGSLNYYNGSSSTTSSSGLIPANAWTHIAIVRSSGTVRGYVNGTQVLSQSSTPNTTSARTISVAGYLDDYLFEGYIADFRVVKSAVYTSGFTPPTAPLTAITNTSLLTCQSNRFRDASTNNFAITRNGDVRVTPFSPYAPTAPYSAAANGGSIYFDGNGDYLSAPNNTAFAFGTGDFTIELWCYLLTYTNGSMFDTRLGDTSTGASGGIADTNGNLGVYVKPNSYTFTGATVPLNAWTHVAFVRSSGTMKAYVNGVGTSSSTVSDNLTDNGFRIAANINATPQCMTGFISGMRVVKGTAVYSANFTPPTAPVTAISGTSLLLNGTNAAIFDSAADNDLETVGNAQISTSVKKFGTGSIYFDGSGDYIRTVSKPEFGFGTGDFTVELWVYCSSFSAIGTLVDFRSGPVVEPFAFSVSATGLARTYDGGTVRTGGQLTAGAWNHLAWVRSNNVNTVYVNGVSGHTWTATQDFGASKSVTLGYDPSGQFEPFNGYIDDLRITKGVARYTANFTPPAAPFPDQ